MSSLTHVGLEWPPVSSLLYGTTRPRPALRIYRPLPPGSIRLLEVLPADDDADPISLQLYSIPLEDASPYDVLSYAWGDAAEDDSEVVLLNDVGVRVTRNLFSALRWLRHISEPRTVWIDALCVDVTDMTDRSQHVGLIRKIYTSAEKVIMWTGERGDVSSGMLFQVPMGRHEAAKHKKLLERPLEKFPVLMCSEASEFRLEALGVSDAISEEV
ncbi:heterokaryon incompatibility domain-containing protein [Trichoderma aethiopicum]